MNKHQQILERFCGTDEMRAWMMTPNKVGDKVVATDSVFMAIIPAIHDPERKEADEKTKTMLIRFLNTKKEISHTIPLENIQQALAKCQKKKVPATKICQCCKGDGYVEYDFEYDSKTYEKELECPICNGDGEVNDPTKPSTLEYSDGQYLKIKESYFFPKVVEALEFTTRTLGEKECVLIFQESRESKSVFLVGDVEILLMPALYTNESVAQIL